MKAVLVALLVLCCISAVFCERCDSGECINRCYYKKYLTGRCVKKYFFVDVCECTNRCSAVSSGASKCRALCRRKGHSSGTCHHGDGLCYCGS